MQLHLSQYATKAMKSFFFVLTLFLFTNSHPLTSQSSNGEDKLSLPIETLNYLDKLDVDQVLIPEILETLILDDNTAAAEVESFDVSHPESRHRLASSKSKRFDFGFAGLDTYDAIHRALGQGLQNGGRLNGATLDMLMKMRRHG